MVEVVRRAVYYFEEPGPEDTDLVLEAVKQRLAELGPRTVVVASDSGRTAVKLCETLGRGACVIAIS